MERLRELVLLSVSDSFDRDGSVLDLFWSVDMLSVVELSNETSLMVTRFLASLCVAPLRSVSERDLNG